MKDNLLCGRCKSRKQKKLRIPMGAGYNQHGSAATEG